MANVQATADTTSSLPDAGRSDAEDQQLYAETSQTEREGTLALCQTSSITIGDSSREEEEGGGKRNYEHNLMRGVAETMEMDWSHNLFPTREGN